MELTKETKDFVRQALLNDEMETMLAEALWLREGRGSTRPSCAPRTKSALEELSEFFKAEVFSGRNLLANYEVTEWRGTFRDGYLRMHLHRLLLSIGVL